MTAAARAYPLPLEDRPMPTGEYYIVQIGLCRCGALATHEVRGPHQSLYSFACQVCAVELATELLKRAPHNRSKCLLCKYPRGVPHGEERQDSEGPPR